MWKWGNGRPTSVPTRVASAYWAGECGHKRRFVPRYNHTDPLERRKERERVLRSQVPTHPYIFLESYIPSFSLFLYLQHPLVDQTVGGFPPGYFYFLVFFFLLLFIFFDRVFKFGLV